MKKLIITSLFSLYVLTGIACDACRKQQPRLLQGITHGAGPDSNWEYLIVLVMIGITLYTLFASIKSFISPSEDNAYHIKRSILKN